MGDARPACELDVDEVRLVAVRLPEFGEIGGSQLGYARAGFVRGQRPVGAG